jgi:hypothetical protein
MQLQIYKPFYYPSPTLFSFTKQSIKYLLTVNKKRNSNMKRRIKPYINVPRIRNNRNGAMCVLIVLMIITHK